MLPKPNFHLQTNTPSPVQKISNAADLVLDGIEDTPRRFSLAENTGG